MRALRLYLALVGAGLQAIAMDRGRLVLMILIGSVYQSAGIVFIWITVRHASDLAGWSIGEVTFLYGLRLCARAAWLIPFGLVMDTDQVVRTGEFDRYLVRPLNPLLQIAVRRAEPIFCGDALVGLLLLGIGSSMIGLAWSPLTVLLVASAALGGGMIELSLQLLLSALSFRVSNTRSLRVIVDQIFNIFGNYPLSIFPLSVNFLLTFVVPLAFVAYIPAGLIFGNEGSFPFVAELGYATPLLGGVLLWAAYTFWCRQSRAYST